mmetsp:Transcript_42250/g.113992  ORF Transcript_42250/g.113992 Transcript_42250/m.113992 type:complete len:245 (-) Transcript_42250:357-1091(-)
MPLRASRCTPPARSPRRAGHPSLGGPSAGAGASAGGASSGRAPRQGYSGAGGPRYAAGTDRTTPGYRRGCHQGNHRTGGQQPGPGARERIAGKVGQVAGGGPRPHLPRVLDARGGAGHRVRRLHVREGIARWPPAESHGLANDARGPWAESTAGQAAQELGHGVPHEARRRAAAVCGVGLGAAAAHGDGGAAASQRVPRGAQGRPGPKPCGKGGAALEDVGAACPDLPAGPCVKLRAPARVRTR